MSSIDAIPHGGIPAPTPAPSHEPAFLGLSRRAWIKVSVIVGLMAIIFWPNLRRLFLKTNPFTGEPNWGHSVVIPLVGFYYLFIHRDELVRTPVEPLFSWTFTRRRVISALCLIGAGIVIRIASNWVPNMLFIGPKLIGIGGYALMIWGLLALVFDWGLATLIFGLAVAAFGIYPGRNDTLWDYGMVVTLFGVVLLLCGWKIMSIAWFPIVFLFCAIPFPGLVYSKIAGPLQHIAADVAVTTLQLTGVDAEQGGTKIYMSTGPGKPVRTLNVAEACAGLRSLMTFISLGAAMAFLSTRPLWQKLIITLSAIPIAIGCNVMRVAGQGILDHYVSHELSESFAHQFVGMVMLVPAFFLLLLIQWILDRLFVEEVGHKPGIRTKPIATGAAKRPAAFTEQAGESA